MCICVYTMLCMAVTGTVNSDSNLPDPALLPGCLVEFHSRTTYFLRRILDIYIGSHICITNNSYRRVLAIVIIY